ncbi:uncharacterized protein VTP21DRAFT_8999 [Calcarisporiella thermophila]|uniref:uncharacterized protein n=1 Tax=Calcarisporiella thermophila TaxID=911321 RepID=UPI0037436FE1
METFYGHVKTPRDAILLFEACRRGILRRVQRRLSDKERGVIRSGAVFVWDEQEAGMRRWTDGMNWSPSRVSGSFLSYRELEHRRRDSHRASYQVSGDSATTSIRQRPAFKYKPDGLIKQSYSVGTADNRRIHLISYYTKRDVLLQRLKPPSRNNILSELELPEGYYLTDTAHPQPPHARNSVKPNNENRMGIESSYEDDGEREKLRDMEIDSPTGSFSEDEAITPLFAASSYSNSTPHQTSLSNSASPEVHPAFNVSTSKTQWVIPQTYITLPACSTIAAAAAGLYLPIPPMERRRLFAEDERQLNAVSSLLRI